MPSWPWDAIDVMAPGELSREARRRAARPLKAVESVYKALVFDRRWFAVVSAAAEDFRAKKMYYYTGNFTYNAFLAIIALLVAFSALLGYLASSAEIRSELAKAFESVVPIFGSTPDTAVAALRAYRGIAGVIGLAGLLWTGTKIFKAMEWGFCEVWGGPRRGYLRGRLIGMLLISILGMLFLAVVLVQFGFAALWGWAFGEHGAAYSLGTLVAKPLVGFLVNFLLFMSVYKIVPTVRHRWRDVAPGAAAAAALFLGVQYLLNFYFSSISNMPSVYGSVSTVIIILVWLQLTGMLVFFGAEVIYVSENDRLVEEHRVRAGGWSLVPDSWTEGSSGGGDSDG